MLLWHLHVVTWKLTNHKTRRLTALRWFQETLHFHTRSNEESEDSRNAPAAPTYAVDMRGSLQKYVEKIPDSQQSLLKNWLLMSSIITYCVFQLHDMAYMEVIQFSQLPKVLTCYMLLCFCILLNPMLFRSFHYGLLVLGSMEDWATQVQRLVKSLQFQVNQLDS